MEFQHILITGASSGIGEALAIAYAAPGIHLSLSGRDAGRLESVAQTCRSRGAFVESAIVDVIDASAMAQWIAACDARAALDLVIANAGVSGGMGSGEQTRRILHTNIDGVVNTVLPTIDAMRVRARAEGAHSIGRPSAGRRGQIAIISSLAAFRGLASAPAYGASKAAVRVWGEGLRGVLAKDNIGVSVVCPGFVVSRMTDVNKFPMPLLMKSDKAAYIIQRGIAANRGRISFPGILAFLVVFLAALPDAWADRLTRRLPQKN